MSKLEEIKKKLDEAKLFGYSSMAASIDIEFLLRELERVESELRGLKSELGRVCYICGEQLFPQQTLEKTNTSWYMMNVAPHAASGGSMHSVHDRCQERPTFTIIKNGPSA